MDCYQCILEIKGGGGAFIGGATMENMSNRQREIRLQLAQNPHSKSAFCTLCSIIYVVNYVTMAFWTFAYFNAALLQPNAIVLYYDLCKIKGKGKFGKHHKRLILR